MTDEKPVLSISQLNMMSKCGQQYYYRYVDQNGVIQDRVLS